jgi:hypothetical protein
MLEGPKKEIVSTTEAHVSVVVQAKGNWLNLLQNLNLLFFG